MRSIVRFFASIIMLSRIAISTAADTRTSETVALRGCTALKEHVNSMPGMAPSFLRSYDAASGRGAPSSDALKTAAFVYDNSLAVIALLACGDRPEAVRIGEALRLAATTDLRLRNVYRAGDVADAKPLPNGWWDSKSSRWVEDPYQQGTATGNVAWAALAMLDLYETTRDSKWAVVASKLAQWVIGNVADSRGGFTGGMNGFDSDKVSITWKSTEHNIDLVAVFDRLQRDHISGDWKAVEKTASDFVRSQWDPRDGRFFIGTKVDGTTPNRDSSGLDAQLWSQLLADAPSEWRRAITFVEREHRVKGGFDFNTDRDGVWIEGTAQVALVFCLLGRDADANVLFATIQGQFSDGGFVYATREPKITTGLSTDPSGGSADFYYYRLPHLGATAWSVLAAKKINPFIERPR